MLPFVLPSHNFVLPCKAAFARPVGREVRPHGASWPEAGIAQSSAGGRLGKVAGALLPARPPHAAAEAEAEAAEAESVVVAAPRITNMGDGGRGRRCHPWLSSAATHRDTGSCADQRGARHHP